MIEWTAFFLLAVALLLEAHNNWWRYPVWITSNVLYTIYWFKVSEPSGWAATATLILFNVYGYLKRVHWPEENNSD